jgi:hypothetical protein
MNFELLYALKMLGDGLEPYYVTEALLINIRASRSIGDSPKNLSTEVAITHA